MFKTVEACRLLSVAHEACNMPLKHPLFLTVIVQLVTDIEKGGPIEHVGCKILLCVNDCSRQIKLTGSYLSDDVRAPNISQCPLHSQTAETSCSG